jgi:3-hydroxybutyryl-CoA dehydrogenase
MARQIERVGVVGLGAMGAGIVEVFARHGLDVVGVERTPELRDRGQAHVQRSTDRAVTRDKLGVDAQAEMLERITLGTELGDLAACDLVVEAVVERMEVKRGVFVALDAVVSPDAVLATNTSSLSVTEISAATSRPHRVIGLHFFNPAPVQRLVEVVRTVVTDAAVVDDVVTLARDLGKNPVVVGDRAGFLANALLFGYLNSAITMYEGGHATREDIDAAMRHGCGYPMGPLALLDLIGLDTAAEILHTMHRQSGDRLHAPPPLLRQMATAGRLGQKTGRGFYTYSSASSPVVVADGETPDESVRPRLRRPIRRIGVVGSGRLASAVVELCSAAGFDVTSVEPSPPALSVLADADLVVEAGMEPSTASLLAELDSLCKPGTILATTSPQPVIGVASTTSRPADVVGMHFAPVSRIELVEVVSSIATDPDVAETARALVDALGRVAVATADRGGILEPLLFPYLNDAVRMLETQYASADDIDTAMREGCRLPRGPIEMLDDLGTDVVLAGQRRLYDRFREPGLAPAPLLEHLVTAGRLGRSTGRGFRDHSPPSG